MAKKKVQYQDKTKFNESNNHITGKWTNTDANELKEVVNNNADMLHEHSNKTFLDLIDQDLSTSSSPIFQNLTVVNQIDTNVLSASSMVNTQEVNATNEVNTNIAKTNYISNTFNINTDTLVAQTQIDTQILNADLQVNTDVLNATTRVNTDIVDATSQVLTDEVRANVARIGEQSSNTFVSGFAGTGYRLAKDANGNYLMELDRLTVRKDFTVYELIVSQIRATNGSLWVSDAIKLETATKVGNDYRCTIDTDGDTIWIPFTINDIVRCQRFNGKSMKYYTAKVIAVNATDKHFTLQVIEGASVPEAKDDLVRIGNTTDLNRQGAVYLTASDNGAPFIDVIDGVANASLANKTKVRLGKLDGIVDPDLGALSGYGLYANSAFIKGKLIVQNGSNVFTKAEANTAIDSAKNNAINQAKVYTDAQNQTFYNDAKTYADQEIAELRQSVNDLETEIEGVFADGIIQEAEAISIEKYLNVLAREKADIDNQFTIVYANTNLTGTAKTNLNTAKTALNTSYTSLVSAINTAIADGKTTPTEKTAVDTAFADFKTKNATYSTRVNEALEAIRNKGISDLNASMKSYSDAQDNAKEILIKAYADGIVTDEEARAIADANAKLTEAKNHANSKAQEAITSATNNAKAYTDEQIEEMGDVLNNLESTINTTFQDGIIEKAEAISIEKYLNEINVEKLQLDNQYSIVYANTNLTGTAKTNLASAKTTYNSNHTTLINSINNAIQDGKTTESEKNAVNTHFGNYRTALGTLSTRIQEAIEAIRAKASTDLDTSMKAYALAQDNLKETIIKAYADGVVDAEEARAIADAHAKLAEAKADAAAQANSAKQQAIDASAIDAQNKANQAQANAIASANQFSLDAVKAITIGNRNLLSNSNVLIQKLENENLYLLGSYTIVPSKRPLEIGKKYTLVVKGSSSGAGRLGVWVNGQQEIKRDIINNETNVLKYITFTVTNTPTRTAISFYHYPQNSAGTSSVEWACLYEGEINKPALDWTPAPEDINDALEIFKTSTTTKFEVLDTAIQSKVSQSDYNALNQRVGTAESTIIQHANQIQSKVSQTAFDTLNNSVGGLSGRVSSAESSIIQQAGLIATKVTQSQVDVSVGNAVNAINIGGRNILKNSRVFVPQHNNGSTVPIINQRITEGDREFVRTKRTNITLTPNTMSIFNGIPSANFTMNPKGQSVVMSFMARASHITNWTVYIDAHTPNSLLLPTRPSITIDTEWRQFSFLVDNFPDITTIGGIRFTPLVTNDLTGIIADFYLDTCEFKIELGNKPTTWSPAPEDVDAELSGLKSRVSTAETSITQNADAIVLRATKTEVTTAKNDAINMASSDATTKSNNAKTTAVSESKTYTDSQITVANNAILLKADKSITDALTTRMNSAELKITDSAIISTVKASTETIATQKATDAVNNLTVGQRNLLRKSNSLLTKTEGDGKYAIGFYEVADFIRPLGVGKKFTLVVKGSNSGTGTLGAWVNGSQQIKSDLISNESGVIKTIVFTRNNVVGLGTNISFYHYPNGSAGTSSVEWACLYEGDVTKPSLDWTPAPDDAIGDLSVLTNRVIDAETSITQNTGQINLRATKTEVTNQVSTAKGEAITSATNNAKTYTDSQITVANNAISLKADKSITDGLTTRMSNAEAKITPTAINLTVKSQTEDIANTAMSNLHVGATNMLIDSLLNNWTFYGNTAYGSFTKISVANQSSVLRLTKTSTLMTAVGLQNKDTDNFSVIEGQEYTLSFDVRGTITAINYNYIMRRDGLNSSISVSFPCTSEFTRVSKTFNAPFTSDQAYIMIGVSGTFTGWYEIKNVKVEKGNKATDWTPNHLDVIQSASDNVTTIKDTRNDNETPAWYFLNYKSKTVREFKFMSAINLTGVSGTSYCQLETYVPWTDASGGSVVQTATVINRVFQRFGSTTTWSDWTEIENIAGSQSKATQALNDSKTYTNAQISITNNSIALKADKTITDNLTNRMQTAESKITPTAIISTVKDSTEAIANTAVNNITIGGRNYLAMTGFNVYAPYYTGTLANGLLTLKRVSSTVSTLVFRNLNYDMSFLNGEFTFSGFVKINGTIPSASSININGLMNSQGGSRVKNTYNETNGFITMVHRFTGSGTSWFLHSNIFTVALNETITIDQAKFEKGNVATAWTPAQEDIDNSITDLGTRMGTAESSITQQAGLIATKVSQSQVDTSISGAINDIQVGGRNLLRNSHMVYAPQVVSTANTRLALPDGTDYIRTVLNSNSAYSYVWTNNFPNSVIREYPMTITFSADLRAGQASSAGKTFRFYGRTQSTDAVHQQAGKVVTLTEQWQRFGVTLDITKEYSNLLLLWGTSSETYYTATTGDILEIKNIKIEKGNKFTDWSPAPEDIENTVNLLSTRVTDSETAITQNTTAINLRATKTEVTSQVNNAKTSAISESKTYTDGQITITNNAINLKSDKTVTDGLTTRMNNAEAKITADAINLTVKAQTQQIANQATAQTFANGKMLYTDPAFVVGENGMVQYPSSVGTVMSRVNNQSDSPTKNNIAYRFVHTAMADSNRCSLVRWANQSRANAVFVTRIVAKLPVGWRIQDAHNTYGDSANRSVTWLTPTLGTGMYEEYVLRLVCGNTGTFSTINHFDLRKVDASTPTPTTANPIESFIAWATVYDMSEVYNKPDEEEIKAGISITANSVNVFGKALSLAGKVTFTSLDSNTQGTINTASTNASNAVSTASTASSNASTALSTANTANSTAGTANTNASNAISTANTANSNASSALSTAGTANSTASTALSNANNAKSKTDAWTYTGKTTINGGQIEANTITADKINTDNLTARQIKTSDLTSRLSINESNDNTIKIRHTNGQVAISMGLVGGVPKIIFYDSAGAKVWEGGTAGIVYVNDVPESWTMSNLYFLDSITTATETLTTTKISSFKSKIKLNSSGSVTNRQMNAGTNYYLYSEGINATSGTNKQYAGYHTAQVKSVSNFIPNGWYVFGNSTLFSDGPGSGTYSATVFKVFNGAVQDDYDIISGIS